MKLSRYSIIHKNYPAKGNNLVWSGFTEALVELNDEVLDRLKQAENGKPLTKKERKQLQPLLEAKITVPRGADEDEMWRGLMADARKDKRELRATVLTTWACNLACPYCIEGDKTTGGHMSSSVAAGTAKWLNDVSDDGFESVRVMFYGGEPLLNISAMERVAMIVSDHCRESKKECSYSIVSNGVLLNKNVVETLVDIGVKRVQLTLDGDKDAHDKRRPMRGGGGSFDKIMANLRAMTDHLEVYLGGNLDEGNQEAVLRLLDHLAEKGCQDKLAEVDFMPATARFGAGDSTEAERTGVLTLEKKGVLETLAMKEEIVKRGFRTSASMGLNICPMFVDESVVTIDPEGNIYKCPAFLGKKGFIAGNVKKNGLNARHGEIADDRFWEDECLDCRYLPLCGGGCRFMAMLNGKKFGEIYCRKEVLEETVPKCMEFDYSLEMD